MRDLITLIKESKILKTEIVASTIRMPKEINSFIDGLVDQLGHSKQEIMMKLIEEGIKIAKKELKLDSDEDDVSSNFHILNTNKRNDANDQNEMIDEGIAAAFYDPWKKNIDRIKKGDTVFLYENGVGIIAYGEGSGIVLKKDKYGDKDECHYQKLSNFKVLEKPISAAEIKKLLSRNVAFLRTMSGMPDGQKILDFINQK